MEIWQPVGESLGDQCFIQETWYKVCNWLQSLQVLCFLADLPPILPCQYSLVSMVTHYLQACQTPTAGKSIEKSHEIPQIF